MHFLKLSKSDHPPRVLGRRRACVTVRFERRAGELTLVVQPGSVGLAKADAFFVALPGDVKVLSEDGELLRPSYCENFWVSVESIDPFHLVVDAPDLL